MFCRCVASSRPLTASLNAEPPAAKAAGGFRIGKNGAAGPGVAITATVISVIIAVLFTIFAEPMYMMFGSNEKILPYCIDYGSVMIPYGFVMCWQMLNQSYLVTADKPHIMLVFSILSGCTNIVLDILFMAVWDFGIIGAGLGTIIGMAVGAIPLLLFFNKKQTLHFGKPEFKVSEILFAMANGSSEAVTNLSTAVTTALFNIQKKIYD